MTIFLGPQAALTHPPSPEEVVIHGVEGLLESVYSKRPEHATLQAATAALNRQANALAREFGQALPDELQGFWAAYAGWFAMYSVGPLLANWHLAREALGRVSPGPILIRERWRAEAWWSGRYQIEPALRDELRRRGLSARLEPGALLRALQGPVSRWGASRQRARALQEEFTEYLQARSEGQLRQPVTPGGALWLSVGASSADVIARLVSQLREDFGLASEILDFHCYSSAAGCRRHGLPYRDLTTFLDDRCESEIRRARQWPRWWRHFQRQAADLPCRDQLPIPLFTALSERLRLVLARDTGLWLLRALASRQALDAYQPAVVVSQHTYGPPSAPLVVEARQRGLPCLCLQHGVIAPRYLALPCLDYDEMLVFGEYAREIMAQACPETTRLTVTGHCLYDEVLQAPELSPGVAALRQGADRLVVLCTQFNEEWFYSPTDWWLAEVARACRELGARLIIKVHPSDPPANIARYRSLVQPGDDRVQVALHGQYPLAELLAACDAMITRDSTVVFEANLLDRPVLTVNLSDIAEELPYASTGGALGVYRREDIAPVLDRVLHDPATREQLAATRSAFLEAHTGPQDGQATARICERLIAWARSRS